MNQREIKFRAEYEGKIYPVVGLHFANPLGTQVQILLDSGNVIEVHIDNVHLMQLAGLKDKNGKEIYEGDILRVDGQFIPERMKIGSGLDFHRDILKVYESDMAWMVIGNIYENPELLNV